MRRLAVCQKHAELQLGLGAEVSLLHTTDAQCRLTWLRAWPWHSYYLGGMLKMDVFSACHNHTVAIEVLKPGQLSAWYR